MTLPFLIHDTYIRAILPEEMGDFVPYYSRKTTRIPHYDYSSCNYYFLTICTHGRSCIFGDPGNLNHLGKTAEEHILKIPSHYPNVVVDKYVVMPNHIHLILILGECQNGPDVNQIIGQYKSGVSRAIRKDDPEMQVWQRSFHDHIIRNQESYEKIWLYIESNPVNWEKDCFYSADF